MTQSDPQPAVQPALDDPFADQAAEPISRRGDEHAAALPGVNAHFRRLHPSSLLFLALARIRAYLIPTVLMIFAAANRDLMLAGIFGIGFAVAIATDLVRYFTLQYSIADGHLLIRQGILTRQRRKVPLQRIQNIDLLQNVFHRLLGVAEVRIETASGTEPEAILRVISLSDVQQLRAEIEHESVGEGETTTAHPAVTGAGGDELLRIGMWELVKQGLINDRGLILIGVVLGLAWEIEIFERMDWGWAEQRVAEVRNAGWQTTTVVIASLFFVSVLLLKALSVAWFVLRFSGYRLTREKGDLRVTAGLLSRVSATIPLRRIQFIAVHRPLLARWIHRATIRLETAGGAGKDDEDASVTIARRWFVPVIDDRRVPEILNCLRDGLEWDEAHFAWQPAAAKTWRRLIRKTLVVNLLLAAILATTIGAMDLSWSLLILMVVPLGGLLWHARRYASSLKYARFDGGVVFRSGVLRKKIGVTFFDKIQAVRCAQSPFDRRWGMASLVVDTAAAGPAGHRIDVPFLDEQFARQEFAAIAALASRQQLEMA